MKELTTKEHILHFMQSGYMRLSKYDLKFIQNLLTIINQSKAITTNQVSLFSKLLEKYKRQLDKHNLTETVIAKLPWTASIKDSDPHYTESYISIKDNKIIFRSPYNKNFITAFRNIVGNPYTWIKDQKVYEAEFHTLALRIIVKLANKYYNVVNYCPITSELLNSIRPYDNVEVWTPTLVKTCDRYIIGGTNQYLEDAINDVDLNNDVKTLSLLAEYGVTAHPSVTVSDPRLKFASEFNPTVDFVNTDLLIPWLVELGCDYVYIETSGMDVTHRKVLKSKLMDAGITVKENANRGGINIVTPSDNKVPVFPVRIAFSNFTPLNTSNQVRKVITMTNSTPIDIK